MISELLLLIMRTLVRTEIAASAVIALVLLLRGPVRTGLGAGLAYRLWALPGAAVIASLFPTLSEFMRGAASPDVYMSGMDFGSATALLGLWLGGAALFLGVLVFSEGRFRRKVAAGAAGPAVMGFGWHRLVVPGDFHVRFTVVERDFILRHERTHIARRDPLANFLLALVQTLSWFNPLIHIAAACIRLDQELACDEAVIRDRPDSRRGYAETLLKAQLSTARSPFACAFAGVWPGARHPLELRLTMLARPQPGLVRYLSGGVILAAIGLSIAAAVWIAEPETVPRSGLGWDGPARVDAIALPPHLPSSG